MMSSNADWTPQIHHSHNPSIASIHSFASSSSSSTLASPPSSPSFSNYKEHSLLVQEHEIHESLLHTHQRPHWRKTPLTVRGLLGLLIRFLAFLLSPLIPSFLRRNTQSRKLHSTSYLDGLRGVAAFIVFIDHFMVPWFENLKYGYGSSQENYHFLQLPIIRLLYSGRASVGVFFVISGYVLSSKPLALIHSRKSAELASVLASSVFRRGMRLYLPIIAGTFISMIIAGKEFYLNVPSQTATLPPSLETWGEQVMDWVDCTTELLFPFREVNLQSPFSPAYNGHLWTIPVEYFGSLVVFLVVLGGSGVRTKWRIGFVAGLAGWALVWGRWDVFLFLGGVFLAEVNITNSNDMSATIPFSIGNTSRQRFLSISSPSLRFLLRPLRSLKPSLNFIALLLSLYLLSYTGDTPLLTSPFFTPNPDLTTLPSSPSDPIPFFSPDLKPPPPPHGSFYDLLPSFIPSTYEKLWNGPEFFILSLGSVLLIYSLSTSSALQKPFNTRVAQYLGDISYSLYIVHGMVVFGLGSHLQRRWTGGVDFGAWIPSVVEVGGIVEGEGEGEGGVAPVRDILGWGIQGTYGEGVIWNRDEGMVGLAGGGGLEGMGEGYDAWRYGKAFLVAAVINGAVVLWAADLFWRAADRRVVRFAKGFEGWICGTS